MTTRNTNEQNLLEVRQAVREKLKSAAAASGDFLEQLQAPDTVSRTIGNSRPSPLLAAYSAADQKNQINIQELQGILTDPASGRNFLQEEAQKQKQLLQSSRGESPDSSSVDRKGRVKKGGKKESVLSAKPTPSGELLNSKVRHGEMRNLLKQEKEGIILRKVSCRLSPVGGFCVVWAGAPVGGGRGGRLVEGCAMLGRFKTGTGE